MNRVGVAVVQAELGGTRAENTERVVQGIEEAARSGAHIIALPELFESPYFPCSQSPAHFSLAQPVDPNPTLDRLRALAKAHSVVLPYSFFERAGPETYNSLVLIDADGSILGRYRKTHIPDGPGYQEKYYFRPGDTGFQVFPTRYGRVGAGICWDQWFPECARAMTLMGAEFLLYPTAIGSEPVSAEDTQAPWRRVMVGHAVANSIPIAAANRVGPESSLTFYGASFIADPRGDVVAEVQAPSAGVALHVFDRQALQARRHAWGFFRDRRPEHYRRLLGGYLLGG